MNSVEQMFNIRPSSAGRWFECAASAVAAAMEKPYETSIYAATGTGVMAHVENAVESIEDESYFDALVGKTEVIDKHTIIYNEEDIEAAKVIFGVVSALEAAGGKLETEVFLKAVINNREHEGTSDFVITFDDHYHLVDYKHGAGVPVNARNNKQLLSYLILLVKSRGPKKRYVLEIVQPRSFGEKRSTWEIRGDQLDGMIVSMSAAITRARTAAKWLYDTGEIPFSAYKINEHCKWCVIEKTCPAKINAAISTAVASKLPLSLGNHLRFLLDNAGLIRETVKDAEDLADELLLAGKKVFGYKLIESRGNRSVRDKLTDSEIAALKAAKLIKPVDKYPTIAELEKAEKKGAITSAKDYTVDGKKKPKRVQWDVDGIPWAQLGDFEVAEMAETGE